MFPTVHIAPNPSPPTMKHYKRIKPTDRICSQLSTGPQTPHHPPAHTGSVQKQLPITARGEEDCNHKFLCPSRHSPNVMSWVQCVAIPCMGPYEMYPKTLLHNFILNLAHQKTTSPSHCETHRGAGWFRKARIYRLAMTAEKHGAAWIRTQQVHRPCVGHSLPPWVAVCHSAEGQPIPSLFA